MRIVVKDPEEFEQALREFRRKVQEQGLVREMRRRSHYVPPAEAQDQEPPRQETPNQIGGPIQAFPFVGKG